MTNCASTGAVENSNAKPMTVSQAHAIHGNAGVEFVDPRPAEAIAATTGKIPGARIVSIDQIEADDLPAVFADRSIQIVTTCQAGPRAAQAAAAFAKLGFAKVGWIEGGTQAWRDAGHVTIR